MALSIDDAQVSAFSMHMVASSTFGESHTRIIRNKFAFDSVDDPIDDLLLVTQRGPLKVLCC